MKVQLQNVCKRFGPTTVVDGISFEIQNGEMFFLLGPSGCGKTTVLRMIAGFYPPDAGEIRFDNVVVNDVPPNRRNTGMVFQNYALWPHMTVAENIAYGLDVRAVPAAEKEQRVRQALETVQMTRYAERSPTQLSGGQQQRVALARALVVQPGILLLDEPLSNLDAQLRLEMRDEIKRIHHATGLTTLYVTHDQQEALSLADRVAVMNQGRCEQIGSPREIYRSPRTRFVAEFMGEMNFISGTATRTESNGTIVVQTEVGECQGHGSETFSAHQKVWCGFRPEAVHLGGEGSNTMAARVQSTTYLGEVEQIHFQLSDGTIVKVRSINPDREYKPGESERLCVSPVDVLVFPR